VIKRQNGSSERVRTEQKVPSYFNCLAGRGSRIRTCDLEYPKLPRYQTALYPARTSTYLETPRKPRHSVVVDTRFPWHRQCAVLRQRQRRKIGEAIRSPGSIPSFLAVPAATSSTARTGPPEGMILRDSVSVFSAMRRMRPSL
jgi:hypothetical protein